MNTLEIKQFQKDLLDWYDESARELPWRSNPLPYQVWVSEIMLQQTRVEAVKPYFARFMKQFPNMISLADADDVALHKIWEGLGYYSRVRNMKKCAQQCVALYQGNLPSTAKELKTLPGIGDYTAGAIASIAYHEVVPAVDGNVLRVFSRLLVCEDDILSMQTKKKFHDIIQPLMPLDRPDAFNQAVMEIGAMICVPNAAPRCNICPLAKYCLGYQQGKAHYLPIKKSKKPRKIVHKTIIVLAYLNKIGIIQRPETGLLASLYEFINLDEKIAKKELEASLINQGYVVKTSKKLSSSKHIFTHLEWHMKGYLIACESIPSNSDFLWVDERELRDQYAIPTALKIYREEALQYLEEVK